MRSAFSRVVTVLAARRGGWSLALRVAVVCAVMPLVTAATAPPARGRAAVAASAAAPSPQALPVELTVGGDALGALGAIERGVPLASADALVPALGGSIVHPQASSTARIVLGGHVFTASAAVPELGVDGSRLTLPVSPLVIGGQFYLPVAVLAEAAGAVARWPAAGGAIAVTPDPASRARLSSPAVAADRAVPVPAVAPAVIPYTSMDLDLMARVVQGEASGQPVGAKVGVAAVIVNRVRDPGWPKTIPGVIYAPDQFQAVGGRLFERPPTASDVQAALAALHGADPTHGATYFYNPAQTWGGSWIFTRTTIVTVGAFRFAR